MWGKGRGKWALRQLAFKHQNRKFFFIIASVQQFPIVYAKTGSKWFIDLNVKGKALKLSKENIIKYFGPYIEQIFFFF